jgi:hypothetical protein
MNSIERKLANFYIPTENDEDEDQSDDDEIVKYIRQIYKGFDVENIENNILKQQVLMWSENRPLMSRLENIIRINAYDKSCTQSEIIREEKLQIRKISKMMEHQLKEIEKINAKPRPKIVKSLAERMEEVELSGTNDSNTQAKEDMEKAKMKILKHKYNKVAIVEAIKQGDEELVHDLEAQLEEKEKNSEMHMKEDIQMIEDYLNQEDMRQTEHPTDTEEKRKSPMIKRAKDEVLRVGGSPLKP